MHVTWQRVCLSFTNRITTTWKTFAREQTRKEAKQSKVSAHSLQLQHTHVFDSVTRTPIMVEIFVHVILLLFSFYFTFGSAQLMCWRCDPCPSPHDNTSSSVSSATCLSGQNYCVVGERLFEPMNNTDCSSFRKTPSEYSIEIHKYRKDACQAARQHSRISSAREPSWIVAPQATAIHRSDGTSYVRSLCSSPSS